MDQHSQVDDVQVPLHRRIAENLGKQVSSGKLKPGEKLPSERQIARQFQASRATVRTALQHLEQEGLIARRERRSAVVAARRTMVPYMRIACTSPILMHHFNRLAEMQILPPRSQLQLVDMQQADLRQILTRPATGADILITDLEYLSSFKGMSERNGHLPQEMIREIRPPSVLEQMCSENGEYFAAPITISPVMLYYHRNNLHNNQLEVPHGAINWGSLHQMAQKMTHNGQFGLQFRPIYAHLAAIIASRGGELYNSEGKIAVRNPAFEPTIRLLHEMVHNQKVAPLLTRIEQINPFAQGRCGMAVDGFEMHKFYKDKLQDNLAVTPLPVNGGHSVVSGVVAFFIGGQENIQPAQNLLQTLISGNTQRLLVQLSAGLPVRNDLLNLEALQGLGIGSDLAQPFLLELNRATPTNQPQNIEYKIAIENLLLEFWLGLETPEGLLQRLMEQA